MELPQLFQGYSETLWPRIPEPRQILRNARSIAPTAITLVVLGYLEVASADVCERNEEICVRSCLGGGDPRDAGYCLLGCKLAYLVCSWLTGR